MTFKTCNCSILKTFLLTLNLKQILKLEDETRQAYCYILSYNLNTQYPLWWGVGVCSGIIQFWIISILIIHLDSWILVLSLVPPHSVHICDDLQSSLRKILIPRVDFWRFLWGKGPPLCHSPAESRDRTDAKSPVCTKPLETGASDFLSLLFQDRSEKGQDGKENFG